MPVSFSLFLAGVVLILFAAVPYVVYLFGTLKSLISKSFHPKHRKILPFSLKDTLKQMVRIAL